MAVVRDVVPVDLDGAVLAESWSDDTWITGRSVLHVRWRGDRGRLLREQALLASRPAPVPHAVVLAGDLTWMALERIQGQRLDLAWPRLPASLRREAVISGVAVHGDAHLANVLRHDGRLAALLDFEWARIGPPDLELEAACRDDPAIEAQPGMKRAPRVTCRCSPGCEPATPASSSTRT